MRAGALAVDIWNQKADEAYPIAAFTYIIVYKDLNNLGSPQKAQALVDFLTWATTDGQKIATEMDYAPLAPGVQKLVAQEIAGLTFRNQVLKSATTASAKE